MAVRHYTVASKRSSKLRSIWARRRSEKVAGNGNLDIRQMTSSGIYAYNSTLRIMIFHFLTLMANHTHH